MMNIQNMPEYAYEYDFVVARECDGDFWFYGAYKTEKRAYKVALEVGGQVFHRWHLQEPQGSFFIGGATRAVPVRDAPGFNYTTVLAKMSSEN